MRGWWDVGSAPALEEELDAANEVESEERAVDEFHLVAQETGVGREGEMAVAADAGATQVEVAGAPGAEGVFYEVEQDAVDHVVEHGAVAGQTGEAVAQL